MEAIVELGNGLELIDNKDGTISLQERLRGGSSST